ncbi:unnamed protein product, partial [Mesorhabditis spiculigera]
MTFFNCRGQGRRPPTVRLELNIALVTIARNLLVFAVMAICGYLAECWDDFWREDMLVINLRLVGGEQDGLFQGVQLHKKIRWAELLCTIEDLTNISVIYQHIEYRGKKLPVAKRPLQNIRFGEELVVKHALLFKWSALLQWETAFQQTYDKDLKKTIHDDSKKLIKTLTDAQFFLIYPDFFTRRCAIERQFLKHFDRKGETIKSSCRVYFKKIYGEECTVTFEPREGGSRAGCLCIVGDGSTARRFYVKTHHGAGDKSSPTRCDTDLKELFIYKFLEELQMGAEIHFIIDEADSRWMIYIGSREISGFQTLERLEREQPPEALEQYSKGVVQMLFVYSVLMLGDHHKANMGFDGADRPFIVDFFIIGKQMTGVKDLHDNVRMMTESKFNSNLTFDERLKISKEYLQESDFSAVFESFTDAFLQNQKPMLDNTRLVFDKPQKTDDLMEYIDNVRSNICLFVG